MPALRTNAFQRDGAGQRRPALAIKFDSGKIEGMPEPRPYREIFVYSPRVEGLHLRFGAIARGGLRWSDRPEDFRTEVLGLVKAQQVKNAIIVPVGAKGAFVPRMMPKGADRETVQAEGTACYKIFVQTLLDVTDNLEGDVVIPPPDVRRRDGDDPYLVVAADKGTATLLRHRQCDRHRPRLLARRRLRLGRLERLRPQEDGHHRARRVGSRQAPLPRTRPRHPDDALHRGRRRRHERRRVRQRHAAVARRSGSSPRSIIATSSSTPIPIRWSASKSASASSACRARAGRTTTRACCRRAAACISRSLKNVALFQEARRALGLGNDPVTPQDVIVAILKAEVDLLWFGGIGTYVRSSLETDADAGDRANDAIRITGKDIRAKVVGEGANLGVTQRGRIEYALLGGKIDTDAIDNSAGVNASDIEVNVKIAMNTVMRTDKLEMDQRNRFLAVADRRGRRALPPQQLPAAAHPVAGRARRRRAPCPTTAR